MKRSDEVFKPAILFDSMILSSGYPIGQKTGENDEFEDEDDFGPDAKGIGAAVVIKD